MIFFPFFPHLFAPFLGGHAVFALELVPRAPRNTGGSAFCVFFTCKRGGQRVRCDIFARNSGGRRFFCPFLGGVFGSSVPLLFLEGWASEKEAAEATRAEELGGEEEPEVTRRSRRRKKKKKKKKEEKGQEEEENEKNKKEGKKGKQGRK